MSQSPEPNPTATPGESTEAVATAAGSAPADPPPPAAQRTWSHGPSWARLIVVAVLALWADLASKDWAFAHVGVVPYTISKEEVLRGAALPPAGEVVVVQHLLEFKLVLNQGAVFGAGQGRRWFFIGVTFFAVGFALWLFGAWTRPRDRAAHVAVGLLLAGGLGNLYDRIMFACVRDFIHPLPDLRLPWGLKWPSGDHGLWPYVSNVADAFLLVGIGVLLVHAWRMGGRGPSGVVKPAVGA